MQKLNDSKWYYIGYAISGIIVSGWVYVIFLLTWYQDVILWENLPIIPIAILMMPLETAYVAIAILIKIRKEYKTLLSIKSTEIPSHNDTDYSKSCIPLSYPLNIFGSLKYESKELKCKSLEGSEIILYSVTKTRDLAKISNTITDSKGEFKIQFNVPSITDTNLRVQAYFKGVSIWHSPGRTFAIEVIPPKYSNELLYCTRLHNVFLSVSTGIFNNNGEFENKNHFKALESIIFRVTIKDKDTNQAITEESTIQLRLVGIKKIINFLPPTNGKGETFISIHSNTVSSNVYAYQAYFPGNSFYNKAYSVRRVYSISKVWS